MSTLWPKEVKEQNECDVLIAQADDLRNPFYEGMLKVNGEGNPSNSAKLVEFHDKTMPIHLANFERILGDKIFFVGTSLSVADITVFDVINTYVHCMYPDCLSNFPKLEAHEARMLALPAIKTYRESEAFKRLRAFPDISA
jgi:glutathione S-transferase